MSLVAGKIKSVASFRSLTLVSCGKSSAGSFRGGELSERKGKERNRTERKGKIGRQERKERRWSGEENEPLNCAITLRLFVGRRVGIKMWPLPRRWRVSTTSSFSSRRRATGTSRLNGRLKGGGRGGRDKVQRVKKGLRDEANSGWRKRERGCKGAEEQEESGAEGREKERERARGRRSH